MWLLAYVLVVRSGTIPMKHACHIQKKNEIEKAPVENMIVRHAGHNWRMADGRTPIEPSRDEMVKRTIEFFVENM